MDFKAIMRPVRFGKAKPDADAPLVRRETGSRRLAALREAADVLKVLPSPGESLHAIMTGRYDLTDLLDVILSKMGAARHLRIATLSFNERNVQRMKAWTEAGQVERLTLLCSRFFVEPLREALTSPHRIAASRNHCKVVCFHFADHQDGSKFAMEGSANLRTNSNTENVALFRDAALHDWQAAWIDREVSHAQSNKGNRAAAR